MKTSLVWLVVVRDESFRNFFSCRSRTDRAVFQAPGGYWVESRHRVPGVPPLDPPGRNSPGIQMTSSRKVRQESKAHRDSLSPQRLSSKPCDS
jgi:hypothetical protein